MTEVTAEVSTSIDAPSEVVWNALTDPDLVAEYFMGARVATDWKVGSQITWSGEWDGKPFQDKGELLIVKPVRHLAFTHWSPMGGAPDDKDCYHVVDIALGPEGGETVVTLKQSNLTHDATDEDRASRGEFEKNWKMVLDGLKRTAEK